ncbi:hypothetical protein AKJ43_01720 [candidate division MSBL1 archaeon SCGC-AAA261D19]|uniref:Uncharacterized protein n=1 Tax=candidate division MSBL1 archaeon SCGC-AAA261D19 TaxID=1698273 RepID=A0A133V7K7_9EURY|nr:hypothetical protein AKJ43_01720 [candidate division MSBL1 archaeon SCGC-AAA261D19]
MLQLFLLSLLLFLFFLLLDNAYLSRFRIVFLNLLPFIDSKGLQIFPSFLFILKFVYVNPPFLKLG